MADNKFIKTFESHRECDRTGKTGKIIETVKQVDDIYKVGSINIPQSLINSYVKKVKDETQKNLRQLYSDMEIAEELVKYAVDTHLNSDDLPISALLGGAEDEDLGDEIEETEEEEINTEEPDTEEEPAEEEESDLDLESEDESEADSDLDLETEEDDEFEEPAEGEDDTEVEDDTEEDELPI